MALPDPGDEAAGAQIRAVLIPTACAHAQMQNTCTDQQSLEGESPEVFTHKLFFHTLEVQRTFWILGRHGQTSVSIKSYADTLN